ncbi:hypothetical protein D3C87_2048820 [compost metagenome]
MLVVMTLPGIEVPAAGYFPCCSLILYLLAYCRCIPKSILKYNFYMMHFSVSDVQHTIPGHTGIEIQWIIG